MSVTVTGTNGYGITNTFSGATGDYRLSGSAYTWSGTQTLATFGYQYDAVGRITQWDHHVGGDPRRILPGDDQISQMTSAVPGSYQVRRRLLRRNARLLPACDDVSFGSSDSIFEAKRFCRGKRIRVIPIPADPQMHNKELRLFAVLLVIVFTATEAFLAYNTLYTEGEVMQGLFWLLVGINIPILGLALWKPRIGAWCAFGLGALLLPWQAFQNQKLAQIHEEVVAVIHYVDSQKKSTGEYPSRLDGYKFRRPWMRGHLSYDATESSYRITYFMASLGTSYLYTPDGGFDYYPD